MTGLFFKTGEFAALCGVKKDTLLHYDQIGILKPERIEENGYRYYSAKQLYTFDIISALKRLGMSLQEIKTYLDSRDPNRFLALLLQQQELLAQEQKHLEAVNVLLSETIDATQSALDAVPGTIVLEYAPEVFYVAVQAPDCAHFDEQQFLLRSRSLLTWARENGGLSLQVSDIVTQASLDKGSFVEDYYYCRVSSKNSADDVLVKPSGMYAVLYHQGGYDTLEQAYRILVSWIHEHGYVIAGDLYEEDLLHYMSTANPKDYIMKISVKIQDKSFLSQK